jgi:hypothetical protein
MLLAGLAAARANAFIMDMEGFAPPGGNTDEIVATSIQGSFSITVDHGHYWSAKNPYTWAQSDIGGTASDWFLHDYDTPLRIEEVGGNPSFTFGPG